MLSILLTLDCRKGQRVGPLDQYTWPSVFIKLREEKDTNDTLWSLRNYRLSQRHCWLQFHDLVSIYRYIFSFTEFIFSHVSHSICVKADWLKCQERRVFVKIRSFYDQRTNPVTSGKQKKKWKHSSLDTFCESFFAVKCRVPEFFSEDTKRQGETSNCVRE